MKNARAKRAKILFLIVKYANLWGFCCRRRRGCLTPYFQTQICNNQFASKEEVSWCKSRDAFAMANAAIVKVSD